MHLLQQTSLARRNTGPEWPGRVEELQEQLTIWGRPAATGAGLLALLSALPSRAEVSQMTPLPPLLPPLDNGMTRHRWAPPAPLERPLQLPERLDPKAQGQGHASIPHDEESCPPSHRTKVHLREPAICLELHHSVGMPCCLDSEIRVLATGSI